MATKILRHPHLIVALALAGAPVRALNCTPPADAFAAAICADPAMLYARLQIDSALARELAATTDPFVREIVSQSSQHRLEAFADAWNWDIKARASKACSADPPYAECDADPGWYTKVWLRGKLQSLADEHAPNGKGIWPELAQAQEMVSLRNRFSGGDFGHDETTCGYLSPNVFGRPYDDLFCAGTFRLQNGSRLCSAQVVWFSGHFATLLEVDDIVDGWPHLRGQCAVLSGGDQGGSPTCSGIGGAVQIDAPHRSDQPHWNSEEVKDDPYPPWDIPVASRHLDPRDPGNTDLDAWASLYQDYGDTAAPGNLNSTTDWFNLCLTTPDYPPPDQTWPGTGPKP